MKSIMLPMYNATRCFTDYNGVIELKLEIDDWIYQETFGDFMTLSYEHIWEDVRTCII